VGQLLTHYRKKAIRINIERFRPAGQITIRRNRWSSEPECLLSILQEGWEKMRQTTD
jgi:hypothetical protein